MKGKVRISYLIVTWNNENIIQDCIDSLIRYSNYDNEIIVIDNDSKDNTCAVIKELYGDAVKLIESKTNLGFSKANNLGLKEVTGQYVFYVNPDVIFIEDIVTPMISILESRKDIGVVSPRLLYKDLSYQVSTCNFPKASKIFWDDCHLYKFLSKEKQKKYAQAQYRGCENRIVDWTYGAAHFCRKEETTKLGGYPQGYFMYGEDSEFCMVYWDKLKLKTYYLGSSKLIHLGGYSEKQVINSKKPINVANANMHFVKKYYGKFSLLRYQFMLFNVSLTKSIIYNIKGLFDKSQGVKNSKIKWGATWKAVLKYKASL